MIDIDTFVDQDPYHMSFLDGRYLMVTGKKFGEYDLYEHREAHGQLHKLPMVYTSKNAKDWIAARRWRSLDKALVDYPESTLRLLSKWKTMNG